MPTIAIGSRSALRGRAPGARVRCSSLVTLFRYSRSASVRSRHRNRSLIGPAGQDVRRYRPRSLSTRSNISSSEASARASGDAGASRPRRCSASPAGSAARRTMPGSAAVVAGRSWSSASVEPVEFGRTGRAGPSSVSGQELVPEVLGEHGRRWAGRRPAWRAAAGRSPRSAGCAARPRSSESKPSSRKARVGGTLSAGWPSTAAAAVRTRSSRCSSPVRLGQGRPGGRAGPSPCRCPPAGRRPSAPARASRASGRSPSSGWAGPTVNAGANRRPVDVGDGQWSASRAVDRPVPAPRSPASGSMAAAARRRRSSPRGRRPCRRRPRAPRPPGGRAARARAGARRARRGRRWPPRSRPDRRCPRSPAIEENSTKASRSWPASSSSRWRRRSTLARVTRRRTPRRCSASSEVASVDAGGVHDGPQRGGLGVHFVEQVGDRGPVGDVAGPMVTRAPSSAARRPVPRRRARPVRAGWSARRCSAPARASQRATCAPSPPVPPVIRTVPFGRHRRSPSASAVTRTRRRPCVRAADRDLVLAAGPARTATRPPGGTLVESARAGRPARPTVGVLQGGDPAEAPDVGLRRVGAAGRCGRR